MTPCKVLVIDDDPMFLRMIDGVLAQQDGVQVVLNNSPLLALHDIRRTAPDLILLDLCMPEMTGAKVLAQLAELSYRGSVVLVSGYERRLLEAIKDYAGSLGVYVGGILNKPFEPAALQSVLRLALQQHARRSESRLFDSVAPLSGSELRQLLDAGALELSYQPRYRMLDGQPAGIEALARLRTQRQLLQPQAFMPAVFAEGLIKSFSLQVFERLIADLAQLHVAGHLLSGSINLAVQTLADDEFVSQLREICSHAGVDWRFVIVELSAKQPFGNVSRYLDNLLALIFSGCRISIDNFGGGQFALALLKQIPFAEMKIDQSLISGVTGDSRSCVLVRNAVRLGQEFGMQVVAVGGESREDWDFCHDLGCDYFQGYYRSKPLLWPDLLASLDTQDGDRS